MSIQIFITIENQVDLAQAVLESDPETSPDVNIGSGNFALICRTLGWPASWATEPGSTLPAARVAEDARRYLATSPEDAGLEPVVLPGGERATLVLCGRSEGYLPRRVADILRLAELALRRKGPDATLTAS